MVEAKVEASGPRTGWTEGGGGDKNPPEGRAIESAIQKNQEIVRSLSQSAAICEWMSKNEVAERRSRGRIPFAFGVETTKYVAAVGSGVAAAAALRGERKGGERRRGGGV